VTKQLYEWLALPSATRLGKRVPKKAFFEHAALTAPDRRAFSEDIDAVVWQHTLKPATCAIPPYHDDERDYGEIAVLEAQLREPKRSARLAELIHRAIPYPVFLVLHHEEWFAVSTAHKRASRAGYAAVVAEDPQSTEWLPEGEPEEPVERAFLASLGLSGLPQTDCYAVYAAWQNRITALACARRSGTFRLCESADADARRHERLASCRDLEQQIARLRAQLRRETRFNRQVELNTRIKQQEEVLRDTATDL
jgi:hypothetical protein